MVVTYKLGAANAVALSLAAKSKPDGYTLVSAPTSPILFVPHMQKLDYNPLTDFTYICGVAIQPVGILVSNDAPWKTLTELIDYAKKNPGKVKYGSWGVGGGGHVHMELLGRAADIDWVHVPFKGDAPCIIALMGKHVPVAALSSSFVPYARSGKLRLLALLTENRWPTFPDIPTLKELGFNFEFRGNEVLGYAGAKGLPLEILRKLEIAFREAVESPKFKEVMEQMDNVAKFRDNKQFTTLINEVYPRTGQMIKQLGLDIKK